MNINKKSINNNRWHTTLLTEMQTAFWNTCANNALSLFHNFSLTLGKWIAWINKSKWKRATKNDNLLIWLFSNNNELVLTEWMTRGHLEANKKPFQTKGQSAHKCWQQKTPVLVEIETWPLVSLWALFIHYLYKKVILYVLWRIEG